MADLVLTVHSIIRWVVIILAVVTIGRMVWGWRGKRAWTDLDDRLGLFFTIAIDIQILVGLIVYFFFSPTLSVIGTTGMSLGEVMGNSAIRFAAIEHPLLMLAGMGVAHVGRTRSKKAAEPVDKFKQAALFFIAAVILIIIAVPWPFLHTGYDWL